MISPNSLFEILQNRALAKDEDLPETGVGLERERILSSMFIETPIYGTRSSSIVLIGNDNSLSFSEESFYPPLMPNSKTFQID